MLSEWLAPHRITWLHQANPAWKSVLMFLVMLALFFSRDLAFIAAMACGYGGLLWLFSGYAYRKLLLFCLPFALTFLSSALTLALFGKGEHVLWQWGIVKISEESVRSGLIVGTKSLAIGMISLVLLLTTRPVLLFYALMQQFRFPAKYAYSFLAAVRLVPIMIADEDACFEGEGDCVFHGGERRIRKTEAVQPAVVRPEHSPGAAHGNCDGSETVPDESTADLLL